MTTTGETSAKVMALQAIQNLPDDATFDDIYDMVYVAQKVKRGIEDADAGRKVSQDDAERRVAPWRSHDTQ